MGTVLRRKLKRADGTIVLSENWSISFRDASGKRHWKSGFRTKASAERALRAAESKVDKGEVVNLTPRKISFGDLCREFMVTQSTIKSLSPATLRNYQIYFTCHLLPYFGEHTVVSTISPQQCQSFVIDKVSACREARAANDRAKVAGFKTIGHAVALLKTIFNYAIEAGYLSTNPAVRVKTPRPEKFKAEVLDQAEVTAFLGAVPDKHRLMFEIFLNCGLRLGELLGLTWADVDLVSSELNISKTAYDGTLKRCKTESSVRTIPLSEGLVRALKLHRLACPPSELGLVFPDRNGGFQNPSNIRNRIFNPALRKSGIEKHIRLHDLRHSFASSMLAAGVDLKTTSTLLGHSNFAFTANTYCHVLKPGLKNAIDRLSEYYAAQ